MRIERKPNIDPEQDCFRFRFRQPLADGVELVRGVFKDWMRRARSEPDVRLLPQGAERRTHEECTRARSALRVVLRSLLAKTGIVRQGTPAFGHGPLGCRRP